MKWCWILSNSCITCFSIILLMWYTTLIDFCMLNYSCILGINLTWSWCIILLILCWIQFAVFLLRILTSVFIRNISLYSHSSLNKLPVWRLLRLMTSSPIWGISIFSLCLIPRVSLYSLPEVVAITEDYILFMCGIAWYLLKNTYSMVPQHTTRHLPLSSSLIHQFA